VRRFEPIVDHRARMMITRVREELVDRGAADMFKWTTFYSTDVIGELAFGQSFRILDTGKVWLHSCYIHKHN
jgi:hypothetical protein